jgi:hypothetical protein
MEQAADDRRRPGSVLSPRALALSSRNEFP